MNLSGSEWRVVDSCTGSPCCAAVSAPLKSDMARPIAAKADFDRATAARQPGNPNAEFRHQLGLRAHPVIRRRLARQIAKTIRCPIRQAARPLRRGVDGHQGHTANGIGRRVEIADRDVICAGQLAAADRAGGAGLTGLHQVDRILILSIDRQHLTEGRINVVPAASFDFVKHHWVVTNSRNIDRRDTDRC